MLNVQSSSKDAGFHLVYFERKNNEIVIWTFFSLPDDIENRLTFPSHNVTPRQVKPKIARLKKLETRLATSLEGSNCSLVVLVWELWAKCVHATIMAHEDVKGF